MGIDSFFGQDRPNGTVAYRVDASSNKAVLKCSKCNTRYIDNGFDVIPCNDQQMENHITGIGNENRLMFSCYLTECGGRVCETLQNLVSDLEDSRITDWVGESVYMDQDILREIERKNLTPIQLVNATAKEWFYEFFDFPYLRDDNDKLKFKLPHLKIIKAFHFYLQFNEALASWCDPPHKFKPHCKLCGSHDDLQTFFEIKDDKILEPLITFGRHCVNPQLQDASLLPLKKIEIRLRIVKMQLKTNHYIHDILLLPRQIDFINFRISTYFISDIIDGKQPKSEDNKLKEIVGSLAKEINDEIQRIRNEETLSIFPEEEEEPQ